MLVSSTQPLVPADLQHGLHIPTGQPSSTFPRPLSQGVNADTNVCFPTNSLGMLFSETSNVGDFGTQPGASRGGEELTSSQAQTRHSFSHSHEGQESAWMTDDIPSITGVGAGAVSTHCVGASAALVAASSGDGNFDRTWAGLDSRSSVGGVVAAHAPVSSSAASTGAGTFEVLPSSVPPAAHLVSQSSSIANVAASTGAAAATGSGVAAVSGDDNFDRTWMALDSQSSLAVGGGGGGAVPAAVSSIASTAAIGTNRELLSSPLPSLHLASQLSSSSAAAVATTAHGAVNLENMSTSSTSAHNPYLSAPGFVNSHSPAANVPIELSKHPLPETTESGIGVNPFVQPKFPTGASQSSHIDARTMSAYESQVSRQLSNSKNRFDSLQDRGVPDSVDVKGDSGSTTHQGVVEAIEENPKIPDVPKFSNDTSQKSEVLRSSSVENYFVNPNFLRMNESLSREDSASNLLSRAALLLHDIDSPISAAAPLSSRSRASVASNASERSVNSRSVSQVEEGFGIHHVEGLASKDSQDGHLPTLDDMILRDGQLLSSAVNDDDTTFFGS